MGEEREKGSQDLKNVREGGPLCAELFPFSLPKRMKIG